MAWLKRRGRGAWQDVPPLAGVTGKSAIRRDNDTVTFLTNGITLTNGGNVNVAACPTDFLPVADPSGMNGRQGYLATTAGELRLVSIFAGNIRILNATAGATYAGTVTWQAGA